LLAADLFADVGLAGDLRAAVRAALVLRVLPERVLARVEAALLVAAERDRAALVLLL
jgi:hypothetical protein